MKNREKWNSHVGEISRERKEMGVRLIITSSSLLRKDFNPEHLRCQNTSLSQRGISLSMKESDIDTAHLFI